MYRLVHSPWMTCTITKVNTEYCWWLSNSTQIHSREKQVLPVPKEFLKSALTTANSCKQAKSPLSCVCWSSGMSSQSELILFGLSPLGTAQAGRGFLWCPLPTFQAGFSEDLGLWWTLPHSTQLRRLTHLGWRGWRRCVNTDRDIEKLGSGGLCPSVCLWWLGSYQWPQSLSSFPRFLSNPERLKLTIERKTWVDSILRA